MKEQDFKNMVSAGVVDHVVLLQDGEGWKLYAYGDENDEAGYRTIDRLGNLVKTARGDDREWKSLDTLVRYCREAGIPFSAMRLDGVATVV
jgi:hypothetical protein